MPGEEEDRVGSSSSSSTQQHRNTNVTTATTSTSISTSSRKNSSSFIESAAAAASTTAAAGSKRRGSSSGGGCTSKRVEEEEKAKAKIADAISKSLLNKSSRPASFESDHHRHHHHRHSHHQHDCPSPAPLIDLRTHGPNKIPRVPHHPPPLPPPLLPICGKGTLGRGDEGDGELDLGSSSSTTTGEEESRLELELQFAGVDVEALELDEDDSNFPQGEIIKRRAEPEDTKVGLDDDDPGSTLHGPVTFADQQGQEQTLDGTGEGEEDKPVAPGPAVVIPPTFREKCLFYTTAFFILLAVFSLFAFLFLVPFVIDPAFSTIFKEFDPEPTLCYTQEIVHLIGSSNCSWTSCREGCTKEIFNCTQILVRYRVATTGSPISSAFTASSTISRRSRRSLTDHETIGTSGVRWMNNSHFRNHNSNYYNNIDDEDSINSRRRTRNPFFYQTLPLNSNNNNNNNNKFSRNSHYYNYYYSNNYYYYQRMLQSSSSTLSSNSNSNSISSKGGSMLTSATTDDRNIHKKKKHKTSSSSLDLLSPHTAALKSQPPLSSSSYYYSSSSNNNKRSSNSNSDSSSSDSSSSYSWFQRAHLFPNVRGCGYPPFVNCTKFLKKYAVVGQNFSCYYSKVDPKIVVTNFSMNRILLELALSMAIPIPCFIVSVIYIVFAYFKIYAPTNTTESSTSCQTANAAAPTADATNTTNLPATTEPITNNNIASPSRHHEGGPGSSQDDLDLETSLSTDEKTHIIQRSTSRGLNAVASRLPNSKGSQAQGQVIIQMNDLAPNSRNPNVDGEFLLPANNNRNGRAPERNGPTNPAKNKG